MKNVTKVLLCLAVCWATIHGTATVARSLTVSPDALAKTQHPIPADPAARNYLGLSGSGSFRLPQVKADQEKTTKSAIKRSAKERAKEAQEKLKAGKKVDLRDLQLEFMEKK